MHFSFGFCVSCEVLDTPANERSERLGSLFVIDSTDEKAGFWNIDEEDDDVEFRKTL